MTGTAKMSIVNRTRNGTISNSKLYSKSNTQNWEILFGWVLTAKICQLVTMAENANILKDM